MSDSPKPPAPPSLAGLIQECPNCGGKGWIECRVTVNTAMKKECYFCVALRAAHADLLALAGEWDESAQRAANGLDVKYASALRHAAAQLRERLGRLEP